MAKRTIIKTNTTKFEEFFIDKDSKIFAIPAFQRLYLWTRTICRALWQDILRAIETHESHYIGSITRIECDEYNDYITDGQQRLVSFILIGLAILHILKEKDNPIALVDENKRQTLINITEKFIYAHPKSENYRKTLKISLNKDDSTVIKALETNTPEVFAEIPEQILAESHILDNYKYFRKEIEAYLREGNDLQKIFDAIANIEVSVEDCPQGKAQIVYSNKNSKGLPMTQVDLVKNLLMSMFPMENQAEIYEKYWLPIERKVYRKNMKDFVMDSMAVINATTDKIGMRLAWDEEKNLMEHVEMFLHKIKSLKTGEKFFKDDTLFTEESEYVLKELFDMAEIYREFVTENEGVYNNSELKNRVYEFYHIFGGKMGMSVVLYLLKKYKEHYITEAVAAKAVNSMVTLQVRNKFVGQFKGVQRKPFIAIMREMNDRMNKHMDDFLWTTLVNKGGVQGIASDMSLMNYFTNSQLSSGFGEGAKTQKLATRYLLWRINAAYAKENRKRINRFDTNLCVEHIIPPDNKAVWENELGETDEEKMGGIVQRFGNHALVLKASDNDSFAEKRLIYKRLNFPLTKKLGEKMKYTEKDVDETTKLYAEYFIKAFPIPDKYKNNKKK